MISFVIIKTIIAFNITVNITLVIGLQLKPLLTYETLQVHPALHEKDIFLLTKLGTAGGSVCVENIY